MCNYELFSSNKNAKVLPIKIFFDEIALGVFHKTG